MLLCLSFSCPPRFPFNLLRNLALNLCVAPYVLILDVDFVPYPIGRAYELLAALVGSSSASSAKDHRPRVFVLPAFEMLTRRHSSPDKRTIRALVAAGKAVPFGDARGTREAWEPAHACTQTGRWLNSSRTFDVQHCDPFYEPYVLLAREHAPPFDESFRGRGFDKVSFVYELFARGLHFSVAPEVFVLHVPHDGGATRATTKNCSEASVAAARSSGAHTDEDVQAVLRNPGETCVTAFLDRMREAHGYIPSPRAHRTFRRTAFSRGWTCLAQLERIAPRPRVWDCSS